MDENDFKTAYEAGLRVGEVRHCETDSKPFVVIPRDSAVEDLERLLAQPLRRIGTRHFTEIPSWVRYVNKHKDSRTMVYAVVTDYWMKLLGILDDHGDDDDHAGWRQHQAGFETQPTVEWKRWSGSNKREMGQREFAEFLEENLAQVLKPAGAEMLEVARRLEAKTTVDFTTAVRLDNGNEELRYEEKTEAKAGEKGVLQVPPGFTIGLVMFEGSAPYSIDARLRYRIREKQLKIWFDLVNPHLAVRDAVKSMLDTVRIDTGLDPLIGS